GTGGWVDSSYGGGVVVIISEPNRGNVVGMGHTGNNSTPTASEINRHDLNTVWDSRSFGCDILMVEYDLYIPQPTSSVAFSSRFYGDVDLTIQCSVSSTTISMIGRGKDVYFRSDGTKSNPGV